MPDLEKDEEDEWDEEGDEGGGVDGDLEECVILAAGVGEEIDLMGLQCFCDTVQVRHIDTISDMFVMPST